MAGGFGRDRAPSKRMRTKKKAARKAATKKTSSRRAKRSTSKKSTSRSTKASTAADSARALFKQRREFSVIDKLPERIRERARSMYDDPTVQLQDIADFVLIETCPASLRDKVAADLAAMRKRAKEGGHDKWQTAYEQDRRQYVDRLSRTKEVRAAKMKPVALSDSQLSRDYRSAMLVAREMVELTEQFSDVFDKLGDKSHISIGLAAGNLLQLQLLNHLKAAENLDDLKDDAGIIKACGHYMNALVRYEQEKNKHHRLVQSIASRFIARIREQLEARPKLANEIANIADEVKEELLA